MSVNDLRKELIALQKAFLGGKSVSNMKKHEVYHRLETMKKAIALKESIPEPAPMKPLSTGAPKARAITVEKKEIGEGIEVSVPKAPKGGKQSAVKHSKRTDSKTKAEPKEVKPPKVEEKPVETAAPDTKKKRIVPPKVVFDESADSDKIEIVEEPVIRKKVIKKITKKEEVATESTTEPGPASPVPVAAPAAKLPGGVRAIAE